jgi:DNA-binding response OmpR family regulator
VAKTLSEKAPTILAVEDETLIQELIVQTLEDAGFDVQTLRDPEDAIVELQRNDYRVMVTDIDLGQGATTGWDLAHRARELRANIGIVYVTGGSVNEWSANGVPNSILVPKPFAPAQLVTAVSQLMNAGQPPFQ